jgi:hypothetical protein
MSRTDPQVLHGRSKHVAARPDHASSERRGNRGGADRLFGITPFEGNYYIARKYLKTSRLKPNWVPGLCIYKFLYVWLDLRLPDGTREQSIGWLYWLPNPLFFFTAFRPAVPQASPALSVQEIA